MITIGLTGGIGSGKTTVAKLFQEQGIPIYIADVEAKQLMVRSKVIKRKLIQLFGKQAYINETLNKSFLANSIFNDGTLLEKMNAIVHPRVRRHFFKWKDKQKAPYVIKEAAVLFENGGYKNCDFLITVTAPKDIRIARVLERDNTTEDKVLSIMKNQWQDEDKIKLSHFVIENTDLESTRKQVLIIHKKLLKSISKV